MAAPAANPHLAEMFLCSGVEFQRNPNYGLTFGMQLNVNRWETLAGLARFVENGDPRRLRTYQLTMISDAQKADLDLWEQTTRGAKPFYLQDVDGSYWFAELVAPLQWKLDRCGRWSVEMSVLEVLG